MKYEIKNNKHLTFSIVYIARVEPVSYKIILK